MIKVFSIAVVCLMPQQPSAEGESNSPKITIGEVEVRGDGLYSRPNGTNTRLTVVGNTKVVLREVNDLDASLSCDSLEISIQGELAKPNLRMLDVTGNGNCHFQIGPQLFTADRAIIQGGETHRVILSGNVITQTDHLKLRADHVELDWSHRSQIGEADVQNDPTDNLDVAPE